MTTGTIVLRAARWADVTAGQVRSPAVIVVEGNRIAAVDPEAPQPESATIIDLGDVTLLPGLMDMELNLLIGGPGGPEGLPSMLTVMQSSISIMSVRIARSRLAGEPADVLISPRLAQLGLMDFQNVGPLVDVEWMVESVRIPIARVRRLSVAMCTSPPTSKTSLSTRWNPEACSGGKKS